MIEWFKKRWGLKNTLQVAIVFFVFTITGSTLFYVRIPVFHVLGITKTSPLWLKIVLSIAIYQVMLLVWGAVFGQARFFWEFEKKSWRRLRRKRVKTDLPAAASDLPLTPES
ncbi:MAG: prolipoprotein diacylglyceryl transferase [Verrucomicrobia bacterium]|nr:prolipoprotein diacylglyceryl transferase [Verrucomicrobiota bacterium]